MNIDEALLKIVKDNNLTRFEISARHVPVGEIYSPFGATAQGNGIGAHRTCFGYGETVNEAISNTLKTVALERAEYVGHSIEVELPA